MEASWNQMRSWLRQIQALQCWPAAKARRVLPALLKIGWSVHGNGLFKSVHHGF